MSRHFPLLLISSIALLTSLTACIKNVPNPPPVSTLSPEPVVTPTTASPPSPVKQIANNPPPTPKAKSGKYRVKVYFPRSPKSDNNFNYVEPVWRNTDSDGVAKFAIAQLLTGPSSAEKNLGLTPALQLTDASNCGSDFTISISQKVARLQFCRTVVSGGTGDDARALSALKSTLKQFPTIDSTIILDKNGNCLGDRSGENRCLAERPRSLNYSNKLALTSLGPVLIGMTPEEASRAAGTGISQSGDEPSPGCRYYKPDSEPKDISFMVVDGRIARIDIDTKKITTISGATLGDREARIRELYPGQIEERPHEYVPGGKYLTFVPTNPSDRQYRVVFETNEQGIVTRFRSGKLPEVRYIEGCA